MTGPLAVNTRLTQAQLIADGQILGPEDIAVDAQNNLYVSQLSGDISKIDGAGVVTNLVNTGGRPLGLDFDAAGNLIIADAIKGLLSLSPSGELSTLVSSYQGQPFKFADDVDVAANGTIYFSDASTKYGYYDGLDGVLEARPYGRLFAYSPSSKTLSLLVEGLHFANGVAVSADQQSVLVNETYRYRITRYWINGPKKGQSEIFADNLPGWPDGVSTAPNGDYWVALFAPRAVDIDQMHGDPALKNLMAKLPQWMIGEPEKYGLVVRLSPQGEIVESLHDQDGSRFYQVTSAEQVGDKLYLGTLNAPKAAVLQL